LAKKKTQTSRKRRKGIGIRKVPTTPDYILDSTTPKSKTLFLKSASKEKEGEKFEENKKKKGPSGKGREKRKKRWCATCPHQFGPFKRGLSVDDDVK